MLDRQQKHRLAILRHAEEITGNVAATCRYYGISGLLKHEDVNDLDLAELEAALADLYTPHRLRHTTIVETAKHAPASRRSRRLDAARTGPAVASVGSRSSIGCGRWQGSSPICAARRTRRQIRTSVAAATRRDRSQVASRSARRTTPRTIMDAPEIRETTSAAVVPARRSSRAAAPTAR